MCITRHCSAHAHGWQKHGSLCKNFSCSKLFRSTIKHLDKYMSRRTIIPMTNVQHLWPWALTLSSALCMSWWCWSNLSLADSASCFIGSTTDTWAPNICLAISCFGSFMHWSPESTSWKRNALDALGNRKPLPGTGKRSSKATLTCSPPGV